MGHSFTNVQVHCRTGDSALAHQQLSAALRASMVSQSLVEAGPDEPCDQQFLSGPATSDPWIAVYAQHLDDYPSLAELDALTTLLSSAISAAAIGILVHDGSLLELRVARDGEPTDALSSWPGYFEGQPKPRRLVGRSSDPAQAWRDLLVRGAALEALRTAWASPEQEAASELLRRMAPVLGWNPLLAMSGFRSLPATEVSACERLCFRRPNPSQPAEAGGLPVLWLGATFRSMRDVVGRACVLSNFVFNGGATARGLTIVVWGSALEQGLIDPQQVRVRYREPAPGGDTTTALEPRQSASGDPLRVATLGDQVLPGQTPERSPSVEVIISGPALVVGAGEVHIGLVPTANASLGQSSCTIDLEILPSF